jgi:hypothetical protein
MNILVIVPGFGGHNIEQKINIFQKNVNILSNTPENYNIEIEIFNFDCISYKLNNFETKRIKIRENLNKGIIGQFLFKYITPKFILNYDYIIILLDDIELDENTNFEKVIKNYVYYKYDIISFSIKKGWPFSHYVMIQNESNNEFIRQTNMVELFIYIMNKENYIKYYQLLDEKSNWLWGIDFSLYYKYFKLGIIDKYSVKHYYKGISYNSNLPNPGEEIEHNRKKFKLIDYPRDINKFDILI